MPSKVEGGTFRFKTDSNSPMMRMVEFASNMRAKHLKLPYGDQAIFVWKSVFNDMGGFSAAPIAENLFFIRRLTREGRITILPVAAVTSSRRWGNLGVFRTTFINQVIIAGCFLGISPRVLADLYRRGKKDI